MNKLCQEFKTWVAKPPYDGIVWLAWFYVIFACFYAGGGPFAGDLVWFDDRVRLVQIFDWLNGQSWYDRTITRVNAPEGFHTIWSRVVDLPAAGIIAALQGYLGQMRAGMVAAIILPLTETLLLFFAAAYFAEPLVGERNAKLVTLFVLFSSCINPENFTLAGFQVGMVGHHSWYVLLTLTLLGSLGRLLKESDKRSILIGGASIGGLLLVGIEGLPLMAGFFGLMAFLAWLHKERRLACNIFFVTLLGTVFGLVVLPLNQPPDKLLSVSFAEPSILGPVLLGCATLFFALQFQILKFLNNKYVSMLLMIVTALLIGGFLTHLFPELLNGATTALSPEERRMAATEHQEAMGIFHLARNSLDYLRMILPPLLAFLFGVHQLSKAVSNEERATIIFYLGFIVLAFGLCSVYSRYFHYLGLAVSPWLLLIWLTASKQFARDEFYALKSFAIYFLIGPLWLWLVSSANYNFAFGSRVLLFPARMQIEPEQCDTKSLLNFLDLRYGADKKIIVPMYKSDRFLLHTHLQIFFLANFPSQNKFIDAKAFYETGSADEAKRIVKEHSINLATICAHAYAVSVKSTITNQLLRGHMSFGQLLVTDQAPAWLKPVDMHTDTPWLLFEVDQSKL